MLPGKIVGTVVTARGSQPFVIDTPTGNVTVGSFEEAHPKQKMVGPMEAEAIEKQVRAQVSGASDVRIGSFQCPKCSRWVDVVRSPDDWSGDACARCA